MGKTKTSSARVKSLKPTPLDFALDVKLKPGVSLKRHDPGKRLRDRKFIAKALLECIVDGDMDAFKEILKAHYEAVNTTKALKRAGLSKRTYYDAIAPDGNPRLSTVMKMISGLSAEKHTV